uniref:Nonstructural protein NSP1 peptide 2 n=1 Tax=Bovine group B rotavirus TaxID=35334 RepID=D3VZU2_9REOV|nr:nonstructural protein NSP1 peptide 2 [Bovine group B rotavirus]
MDFKQFLFSSKEKKDLIPVYHNREFNPLSLSKKPQKAVKLVYPSSIKEAPFVAGESILIEDVCPHIHEHFCGAIHVPKQSNIKPKGRISHITADKIAWPCGVSSIIINDKIIAGSEFVKCRCGNFYPTAICQQSDFFFLTCCSNDTKSLKLCISERYDCANCGKKVRWFAPGKGVLTKHMFYLPTTICPSCSPFRDLVSTMSLTNKVEFVGPDFKRLREDYDWKRAMENSCESAFRTLNSPHLLNRISVHSKINPSLTVNTLTEVVSSLNREWPYNISITPISRGKVTITNNYSRTIVAFENNTQLFQKLNMLLMKWRLA